MRIWLALCAILTNFHILNFINTTYLKFFPPLFDLSVDDFYSTSFNSLTYAATGIVVALAIPAFISIYGNVQGGDFLTKQFIRDNFKHEHFNLLVFYIACGLISQHSFFTFVLFSFFCSLLLKNISIYFSFLFEKNEVLLGFVKKKFQEAKIEESNFIKITTETENELSKYFECNDDYSISDGDRYLYFQTPKKIKKLNRSKLSQWAKHIRSSFDELYSKPGDTFLQISKPSFKKDNIVVTLGTDREKTSLTFFFYLKQPQNSEAPVSSEELDKIKDAHLQPFRDSLFQYNTGNQEENFLVGLDSFLYDLLKKNEFYRFKEINDLLKKILEENELLDSQILEAFLFFNYRLTAVLTDFDKSRGNSLEFYEFWFQLFETTTFFPKTSLVRRALHNLSNSIDSGVIDEAEISTFDRRITSFYKYQKLEVSFVRNYVDGLISVAITILRYEKIEKKYAIKFLTLITFLRDDFSKEKVYLKDYTTDEIDEIIRICEEGLLLALFFIEQNLGQEIDQEILTNIRSLVRVKSAYPAANRLCSNGGREWDVNQWRETHFDRHGFGGGWSFSVHNFLEGGLLSLTERLNFRIELLKDLSISKSSIHFFNMLLSKLSSENEQVRLFKEQLASKIGIATNKKSKKIIDSQLDREKILNFIQESDESYKEILKISDICPGHVSRENDDNLYALGIYTTLLKSEFISDKDTHTIGLSDFGKYLALGENRKILEDIKEKTQPISIEEKKFYENALHYLIEEDNDHLFLFVGHPYNFYSRAFNAITNECKFNSEIKRVKSEENTDRKKQVVTVDKIEKEVFLIESDKIKKSHFLVIPKGTVKVDFYAVETDEINFSKITTNSCTYEFIHYAENQQALDDILGEYELEGDVLTSAVVDIRLYMTLSVSVFPS